MVAKNPYTGQPYRGWHSTKLHLALIAMALITLGYAMTGWNEHAFDGFVMGILGGAAIYSTGATLEKLRGSSTQSPPPGGPVAGP